MSSHIFSFSCLFIILLTGCNKSAQKSCDARESVPLKVVTSVIPNDEFLSFPHFHVQHYQYLVGMMVGVMYVNADVTGDGSDVFINDTVYKLNDYFTLPVGRYEGSYEPVGCFLESAEGYSCACRADELNPQFVVEFLDSAAITIDSLSYVQEEEDPGRLKALVEETSYFKRFVSDTLKEGVDFSYRFTSAPESSIVTLVLKNVNSEEEEEYVFTSDNTELWSAGWHVSADTRLRIKVSRN